jgi:hypothetical protein
LFWGAGGSPAWGNVWDLGVASGPGGSRVAGMQAGRLRSRVRVIPLGALPRLAFSPSRATTCRHGLGTPFGATTRRHGLEGACFGARAARPHGIAPGIWVWHRGPAVPALRECRRAACAPGSALFHLEHYPVWRLPLPPGVMLGVWVWHRGPAVPALRECRRAACAPESALLHLEHYPVWCFPPPEPRLAAMVWRGLVLGRGRPARMG